MLKNQPFQGFKLSKGTACFWLKLSKGTTTFLGEKIWIYFGSTNSGGVMREPCPIALQKS